jgi:hypothetical protein
MTLEKLNKSKTPLRNQGAIMASLSLSKSVPKSFPHTYRFHIIPDLIRKFQDPTNPAILIHHAYIPVTEFKREMFPDEVNPRSHEQLSGRVPKAIEGSVASNPTDFHLLNRGVLVLAQSCVYDNHTKMLEVAISSPQDGGLADGATTDRVLSAMLDPTTLKNQKMTEEEMLKCLESAFVHVEIISGDFGSKLVSMAGARNTSNQVKEFALDNLDHKFDWLKDVIEESALAGRVRYRENDPQPVDIRTVLAILTMFHPKWDQDQKEPVVAYSGKGGILSYFKDDEWLPGYMSLKAVVVEILELHEYIHGQFKNQYASFNQETKNSGAKFGKRREITYKPGKPQILPLTDTEVTYVVPDGWLYPVVASMRMLLEFPKGKPARWVTSPFEYFDNYGYELVGDVVEQSAAYGFNPQTVGKSRPVWSGLRGKVKLKRIELAQEGKIS